MEDEKKFKDWMSSWVERVKQELPPQQDQNPLEQLLEEPADAH